MAVNDKESLYIVFLDDPKDRQEKIEKRLEKLLGKLNKQGVAPTEVFEYLNGFTIALSEQDAKLLKSLDGVKSLTADAVANFIDPATGPAPVTSAGETAEVTAEELSASSLPAPQTDGFTNGEWLTYGVKAVWNGEAPSTNVGAGAVAFVIDTGITTSTNDLVVDTTWSRSWISGVSATTDDNGHGTHVAGTIAGIVGNGRGVVGVAPGATVVPLKALNAQGSGSYSSIISAINHATGVILDNNLSNSVINMSLGGGGYAPLDQAVLTAADQGVRFAIAAGNSFQDVDTTSPARTGSHPNVYTISAVDANYQLASFSNYDNVAPGSTDKVDYAQPGVRVISWYRNASNDTYSLYYLDGTSMAAPHAAGALLMGGLSGSDLVTTPSGIQSDPFGLVNAVSTPSISIHAVDASKAEGSSGQPTPFTFQLDRSGLDLSASSSVQWQIQAGTTSFSDFSGLLSGTLQFLPGEDTKALSIDVAGDTLFEPDETFSVQLLNPSNAILATSLASATIINDDPAPPGGGNPGKPDLYFTLSNSLTTSNPAIMNGLTADQNDIIGFRSSNQTFEKSLDVVVDGLTGLAIDGFSFRPDGALLVTLKNATTINGINYDDSDILLLKGSSGGYTAEMYFDGSDVGLSTSSEAIDAFTLDGGGNLLISTRGSFSVNGASGNREDILKFTPTSTGNQTAGGWSFYFDGSDVGLTTSSENVNGIALDSLGKLYLTTTGNFSVNGLAGANEDVFRFSFTGAPGSNTAGTFESTLFFDGSLYGLSNYMLAGFDLPLPS